MHARFLGGHSVERSDDVGDGRSKDRSTLFQKPGGNRIRVRLLVRTVEQNLRNFSFRFMPKMKEKLEGLVGGEESGPEWLVRRR